MNQQTIKEITNQIDLTYAKINRAITDGILPLIDMVYPNHDGIKDADAAADLMLLRDGLIRLVRASENYADKINEIIK